MAKYLLGDYVKSGISRRLEVVSAARVAIVILRSSYKVPLMIPTGSTFTQTFTKAMDFEVLREFVQDLLLEEVPEDYISIIMGYDSSSTYWATSSMFKKGFHERLGCDFSSYASMRDSQIEAANWIEENIL